MIKRLLSVASLIVLSASVIVSDDSLPPIVVGGNMLFNSVTKQRFYANGIGYGLSVDDKDKDVWKPAIDYIASVPNANTVRVYSINPPSALPGKAHDANYDTFMNYLKTKNMYAMIPLTPSYVEPWIGCQLNSQGSPALGPDTCYPSCLLTFAQLVINAFVKYTHTLAFVIGNEVLDKSANWKAAPCVKRFVRDVKEYMMRCAALGGGELGLGMRLVPTLYSAADTPSPTQGANTAEEGDALKARYLTCASASDVERVDIFGINVYRWCSSSCSYDSCGYNKIADKLRGAAHPVLLTEYGCDNFDGGAQRDWGQVGALYSPSMTDTFSGGLAYSFDESGGAGFAMFTRSYFSGWQKKCSFGGTTCNYDNFNRQLSGITPAPGTGVGSDVCSLLSPAYAPTIGTDCAIPQLANLSAVPPTRQAADGYIGVECALYPLTAAESTIRRCQKLDSDPVIPKPGGYVGLIVLGVGLLALLGMSVAVLVRLARTRQRATEGLFERSAREGAQGLNYAGITSSRAVFGQ